MVAFFKSEYIALKRRVWRTTIVFSKILEQLKKRAKFLCNHTCKLHCKTFLYSFNHRFAFVLVAPKAFFMSGRLEKT